MLSTVEIFAAGETGQEAFNLIINGDVVQTFQSVGGDFESVSYTHLTLPTIYSV